MLPAQFWSSFDNEIMEEADVKERVDLYFKLQDKALEQIKRCSKVYKNVIILDMRYEDIIYPINRFIIYALYPKCNISVYIFWGFKKRNTIFAVGKSIINKTSTVNIGELMLKYGGGGHKNAGTCQIDNDEADKFITKIVTEICE